MAVNRDIILAEIDITGLGANSDKTLRFADVDISLKDGANGYVYEGRIQDIGEIDTEIAVFLDTSPPLSTLEISINNRDDQYNTEVDREQYVWEGSEVRVYAFKKTGVITAEGERNKTNYDLIFVGIIRSQGGLSITDKAINLILSDHRSVDDKTIPLNIFDSTTYPNADENIIGEKVPNVYGEFNNSQGTDGLYIPLEYRIDKSTEYSQFKMNDGAIKSLGDVYVLDNNVWTNSPEEITENSKNLTNATIKVGGIHKHETIQGPSSEDFIITDMIYHEESDKLVAIGYYQNTGDSKYYVRTQRWNGSAWSIGTADANSGAGLTNAPIPQITDVDTTDNRLYVVYGVSGADTDKLMKTTDEGDSWSTLNTFSAGQVARAIRRRNVNVYIGVDKKVYRVLQPGETVSEVADLTSLYGGGVGDVRVMELFSDFIYIGTDSAVAIAKMDFSHTITDVANSDDTGDHTIMEVTQDDKLYYNSGPVISYLNSSDNNTTVGTWNNTPIAIIQNPITLEIYMLYEDSSTDASLLLLDSDLNTIWVNTAQYVKQRAIGYYGKYVCFTSGDSTTVMDELWFTSLITDKKNPQNISRSSAIEIQGRIDGSSNLIEEPTLIIRDIMENLLSIGNVLIDTTAFNTIKDILTNSGAGTKKAHRYINFETTGFDMIFELCGESGILLYSKEITGLLKYTADYWKPEQTDIDNANEYDGINIEKDSFAGNDDVKYFNKLIVRSQKAPHTGLYQNTEELNDAIAQSEHGGVVEETLASEWMYDHANDFVPLILTGVITETLEMSATSTPDQWTLNGGANKVVAVNGPDDDAGSQIDETTVGEIQRYAVANPTVITKANRINKVTSRHRSRYDTGGTSASVRANQILGGLKNTGSPDALTLFYTTHTDDFIERPTGGRWRLADLQNVEFEIELVAVSSATAQCTTLQLIVEYEKLSYAMNLLTYLATKPRMFSANLMSKFAELPAGVVKMTLGPISDISIHIHKIRKGFTFLTDFVEGPDITNLSTPP